jgi:hypothetical protein
VETSNQEYIVLLKIGSKENILDCFNNNYLYFNTMEYFRSKENDPIGRHDPRDGDLLIKQVVKLTIEKDSIKYDLHNIFKKFSAQYHESLEKVPGNICSFCLYKINTIPNEFLIDPRLKDFGDTALFIYNFPQFIKSVDQSIKDLNFSFARRTVEYYDPKQYTGDLTFFHKDNFFQYQNEYRILIKTSGKYPLKLKVPNLNKTSEIKDFIVLKKIIIEFKDGLLNNQTNSPNS